IAHQRISADGSTMGQVLEHRQPVLDKLVALDVLHLGNEADAARIMFVAGIIQALSIGKALRRRSALGDGGRRIYSGHNSCRKSLLRHLQAPRWAPFFISGSSHLPENWVFIPVCRSVSFH